MTETPAEVATQIAIGATTMGWDELGDYTPGWDYSTARFNIQTVHDQDNFLAADLRRNLAELRAELRAAFGSTPRGTVKLLCCGDSITVPALGSSDALGYPGWIVDLLDRQHITATIAYNAHANWNVSNIANGMAAALAASDPDVVTIHIGTNDAGAIPSDWQGQYTAMLDGILAFSPTVRVACALIPAPQASVQFVAAVGQINAMVAAAVAQIASPRVVTADLRTTTSARWTVDDPAAAPPSGRWTFDGMHPQDAACGQAAQAFLAAIGGWVSGYNS